MMKNYLKGLISFFIIFFLVSCDVFTTSWASWAARGPSSPAVTLDNVDELIDKAKNDPDLSLAVLIKTAEAAAKVSGDAKTELQIAAVEAAANAIALAQTVISVAGEIINIIDDQAAAEKAAKNAIKIMPNLVETGTVLYGLLPKDYPIGPEFINFIDTASAEDLALSAIIIFAGEAKKSGEDIDAYVAGFDITSPPLPPVLEMAAALAAAAGTKPPEELPNSLKNILDGLNLI